MNQLIISVRKREDGINVMKVKESKVLNIIRKPIFTLSIIAAALKTFIR